MGRLLSPPLFVLIQNSAVRTALCLLMIASAAAGETSYGLDARQPIAPYINGQFPPVLPTAATGWTTVEAFPHLRFQNPVYLTFAPNTGRLYVCEREGTIQSFVNDAASRVKSTFLDIRSRCQGWDDCGLLGLAFHPDFGTPGSPNRGYCYVYYQYSDDPVPGPARPPDWRAGRNRLSRFTVPDGSLVADANSELVLIDQNDEHIWHNGGGLFFHPGDGFLYLSLGDEGGASDNFENTNRIDKDLFSGVIRIDVDKNPARSHPPPRMPASGTTGNYWIPNDNPFVGVPNALEEFYCIGLRSPHRMTLDPVSGRIWVGDVGQRDREEINLIERGANYQWAWKEGSVPVEDRSRPAQVIGVERAPLHEYPHADGNNCVIGGYAYRGNTLATELWGKYIFGDNVSGRIWSMNYDGSSAPAVTELCVLPATLRAYTGLSSFGVDENNELYLCMM